MVCRKCILVAVKFDVGSDFLTYMKVEVLGYQTSYISLRESQTVQNGDQQILELPVGKLGARRHLCSKLQVICFYQSKVKNCKS